ncbi:MAG: hypothetical protein PHF63_00970 [Herbinix sp.]|nr:hypothetical protein [Herbinix sp.]
MALLKNSYLDLMAIIEDIEVKYESEAKAGESVESARASDQYISAYNNQSTYYTYEQFDLEAIELGGVNNIELQEAYRKDKSLIPSDLINGIILQQDKITLKNYVELNNYYRTFNGLPDVSDNDFIYISKEFGEMFNIDYTIPIHLIDDINQIVINANGEKDRLLKLYPTKKYLNFLGSNKISIIQSRSTLNFGLLRTPTEESNLLTKFIKIYEVSREYFSTTIYNKSFSDSYDFYDNFIALMICLMTVQRVLNTIFKESINTDFYDLSIIKKVFDQYKVPFIESMPINYQQKLVKSLNYLIRLKSTDKVIYDITSLLGFDMITVYKYYLIKNQKLDNDGNLLFEYLKDENGDFILDNNGDKILDKSKMFNYYFQSVDMKTTNLASAFANTANKIDLNQVVVSDPYWNHDDDLIKYIDEEDFNYMETKYIAFQAMYKMAEMLFEIVHIVRMLINKKSVLTEVFDISSLVPGVSLNLFEITVLLCGLLSRRYGLVGNILYDPNDISAISGFNFKRNLSSVINHILADDLLDDSLIDPLKNILTYKDDPNLLFQNIKAFNDVITNIMFTTTNKDVYRAANNIYKTLMVETESLDMFKMSNGENAKTFREYITSEIPEVITLLDEEFDITTITDKIAVLLEVIDSVIHNTKNIYFINETDNSLLNAMIYIVNYFKSYTIDVNSINILYILDDKRMNTFKFFLELHHTFKRLMTIEDLSMEDRIHIMKLCMIKDNFTTDLNKISDEIFLIISKYIDHDDMEFRDRCKIDSYPYIKEHNMRFLYADGIPDIEMHAKVKDKKTFKDGIEIRYIAD